MGQDGWDEWTAVLRDPPAHLGTYLKVTSAAGNTRWYVCDPFGHIGSLSADDAPDADGKRWEIEEHEDGSITVNHSIWDQANYGELDHHPGVGYHGHLQRGVWTP